MSSVQALIKKARNFFEIGSHEALNRAKTLYEEALVLEPSRDEKEFILDMLKSFYEQANQIDEALSVCNQRLSLCNEQLSFLIESLPHNYAYGHMGLRLARFETIHCYEYLAKVYQKVERYEEAERALLQLCKIYEEWTQEWEEEWKCIVNSRRFSHAIQTVAFYYESGQLDKILPFFEAHWALFAAYPNYTQIDKMVWCLLRVERRSWQDFTAGVQIRRLCCSLLSEDGAYEKCEHKIKNSSYELTEYALADLHTKRYETAVFRITKAIEYLPECSYEFLERTANFYAEREEHDKANSLYHKAISLCEEQFGSKGFPTASVKLGYARFCVQYKEYHKARQLLIPVKKIFMNDYEFHRRDINLIYILNMKINYELSKDQIH